MISSEFMRAWIYICIFSMLFIAVLYLRRRKLTVWQYLLWGLIALLLPIVGPYIVIASQPGELRPPPGPDWLIE